MSRRWRPDAAAGLAAMLAALTMAPGALSADDDVRRLSCAFTDGAVSTFQNGAFISKPAEPLAFTLSEIDLDGQRATLAAGTGNGSVQGGTVRVVRAINANHYLEVAAEGFLNLTTVYDKAPGTDVYPAVHSRHLGVIGEPVYGRYTGTCKAG